MKKTILLAAIVLSVLFMVNNTSADDSRVIEEKTFKVKPGGKLRLEAPGSDVRVTGWNKNEILVKIHGSIKAKDYFEFRFHDEDGMVLIQIKKKGGFWSKMMEVDQGLTVEILEPNEFHTNIETAGGDIQYTGIDGDAKLNTSGGDIEVRDAQGRYVCSTAGGDIIMANVQGNVKCNTAGGGIQCTYIEGDVTASSTGGDIEVSAKEGKINASSTGGDIQVSYDGENKGISLSSTGGDIDLVLFSDLKANLNITSLGGDIECNLNTSRLKKSSAFKFEAEVNGGGPEIKANSTGGDVTIKRR
ncbi:MAG: DUF4097 family beta strand repeat protein [Ignavibacteriales bacterium]|nr:DUF4097 family beta strand repeat protein [Ignavibacteriales bacterium]